ncbi:MAG: diguanylate cyclase [Oscillospiraceae bacterium]|nr:diguanylate cyclase [Oscillospiraceae bacterium]
MGEKRKRGILIIDDEKSNIVMLSHILSPDYTVYASKSGKNGIALAKNNLPDLILLDILMPEMDGYEVLSALKASKETKEIPVIFVTGLSDSGDEQKGLALGAADYIAKPFSPAIVKLRVLNQIKILNLIDEIRVLSVTDQMTGIANRRAFDERLRLEWDRAKRDKSPLTILMIDIDDFKAYNDLHGHLQGDTAMRAVTQAICAPLNRSTDFAARWGGEEFAVLLPSTSPSGALTVAESIRKSAEGTPIPCSGKDTCITVSVGINTYTPVLPATKSNIHNFILKADQALYTAKSMGKNKVCSYEDI